MTGDEREKLLVKKTRRLSVAHRRTNATKLVRIPFAGIEAAQSNDLIAEHGQWILSTGEE